jgi:NitT/TauT family transport system permease protein
VFASTAGAGWNIQFWRDAHRAQGVFGYALFFILFALFLERFVFQKLSRRVFRWRPEIVMEKRKGQRATALLTDEALAAQSKM